MVGFGCWSKQVQLKSWTCGFEANQGIMAVHRLLRKIAMVSQVCMLSVAEGLHVFLVMIAHNVPHTYSNYIIIFCFIFLLWNWTHVEWRC
jgi:hypothetical protein